jgi:hypothetical protein
MRPEYQAEIKRLKALFTQLNTEQPNLASRNSKKSKWIFEDHIDGQAFEGADNSLLLQSCLGSRSQVIVEIYKEWHQRLDNPAEAEQFLTTELTDLLTHENFLDPEISIQRAQKPLAAAASPQQASTDTSTAAAAPPPSDHTSGGAAETPKKKKKKRKQKKHGKKKTGTPSPEAEATPHEASAEPQPPSRSELIVTSCEAYDAEMIAYCAMQGLPTELFKLDYYALVGQLLTIIDNHKFRELILKGRQTRTREAIAGHLTTTQQKTLTHIPTFKITLIQNTNKFLAILLDWAKQSSMVNARGTQINPKASITFLAREVYQLLLHIDFTQAPTVTLEHIDNSAAAAGPAPTQALNVNPLLDRLAQLCQTKNLDYAVIHPTANQIVSHCTQALIKTLQSYAQQRREAKPTVDYTKQLQQMLHQQIQDGIKQLLHPTGPSITYAYLRFLFTEDKYIRALLKRISIELNHMTQDLERNLAEAALPITAQVVKIIASDENFADFIGARIINRQRLGSQTAAQAAAALVSMREHKGSPGKDGGGGGGGTIYPK